MPAIQHITAREILNAKGNPTIETTVILENDMHATASVPSGTSVSSYEAVDLKDDDVQRFSGKGVLKAIHNVTDTIAPVIIGKEITAQEEIDKVMKDLDGTPNKSKLGGNATLSVSLAVARAAALSQNLPLFKYIGNLANNDSFAIPTPLFNLINGGKHALGAFDLQEFIVVPASSKNYAQSLQIGYMVRQSLEKMLLLNNLSTLVGDEGGFSPQLSGNQHGLEFLRDAIQETGLHLGTDVFLGIDAAATSFHENNKYYLQRKTLTQSSSEMAKLYAQMALEFNMLYMEDPFAEDDWEGWKEGMTVLSKEVMVVGDDLISTNPARLQMAINQKAITATIIKPNQIGTISETLEVVTLAKQADMKIIVSHRSGETNDDFIADFAVGIGANYCKFGAPVRGERVAKYNRLLEIEKEL